MYREPHLQKKSEECHDLWWAWKKLWDINMSSKEAEEARQKWNECTSEFSEMISYEVKTNPRYQGIRV
tara:strand:+ start:622 stop:825 length:204 start_codon:yes stop_codon:yes gene_type:complete